MNSNAAIDNRGALLLKLRTQGIRNTDVLRAIETIPREAFVPHQLADLAQRDLPLPIACGQTMSEPSLVARMLEALDVGREHRVLEIGTGSGYVTAILANLARQVVSIDRFHTLAAGARTRLQALGINNAEILCGDGLASAIAGPFDRILVHLSLDELAASLTGVLAADGLLVCGQCARQGGARLLRFAQNPQGFDRSDHGSCMLPKPIPGIAAAL
jgi:protein-L-isoaspartate(D-aspartate) O-methyltransferase